MIKQKQLSVYRYELKYYINYIDYLRLKDILLNFMKYDENACTDNGYWIRSLYFDTPHNKEYMEKIMGLEHRKKIRLRIYDCDMKDVKLEIKKKHNDYIHKETAVINRDQAQDLIQGKKDFLLESNNQTLNRVYYYMTQEYYFPVVIVDYLRDAFVEDFNNIRITFDQSISSCLTDFDIFKKDLHMLPALGFETIVLEVKYNHFLPRWLKDTLSCIPTLNSSISKYCFSREAGLLNS